MIEIGLIARLKANVASVGGRVFPGVVPQNTAYPALAVEDVTDPRGHTHEGPDGTVDARYTVTVFGGMEGGGYGQMKQTAVQVESTLDGFSGAMGDDAVASIRYEGGPDLFDNEVRVHYRPMDFIILYTKGE